MIHYCITLKICNLGKRKVETFNLDYVEHFTKVKQDIIYIDAPWGGKEYKYHKRLALSLSNVDLDVLVDRILKANN